MKYRMLLFVIFSTLIIGVNAQKQAAQKDQYFFDLHKISPVQLLSYLDFNSDTAKNVTFVTVSFDVPENWVGFVDVVQLMKSIHSEVKCKCVIKVYSSYLPVNDYSTVGGQAMNLIDSYRTQKPYFEGSWNCAKTDSSRIKEIEKWYGNLKSK